jgi:lactoylglutathione lyase
MNRYSFVTVLACLISSASFGQKVTINHTAVFVVDCKASAKFYHEIVGLDTIPEPFHDGKHVWMKTGPRSALHIIEGSKVFSERVDKVKQLWLRDPDGYWLEINDAKE